MSTSISYRLWNAYVLSYFSCIHSKCVVVAVQPGSIAKEVSPLLVSMGLYTWSCLTEISIIDGTFSWASLYAWSPLAELSCLAGVSRLDETLFYFIYIRRTASNCSRATYLCTNCSLSYIWWSWLWWSWVIHMHSNVDCSSPYLACFCKYVEKCPGKPGYPAFPRRGENIPARRDRI